MGNCKTLIASFFIAITTSAIIQTLDRNTIGVSRRRVFSNTLLRQQVPRGLLNQSGCWCSNPGQILKLESFQGIGETSKTNGRQCVLAFSAYFDRRNRKVTIVTDSDMTCYKSVKIACHLWYHGYVTPFVSSLALGYVTTTMPGEAPRIGVIYYCDTPGEAEAVPYAVSFLRMDRSCSGESSCPTMEVVQPKQHKHQFAVCVPPLFGDRRSGSLIGFMEMHRILGAEKFYFYIESIPKDWETLLQAYQELGIVQVVQWHSVYPDKTLYHNQQIVQADCMYRNMDEAQYVAQMDVDEVLMTNSSWLETLRLVERNDTAAFMFLHRLYSFDTTHDCDYYRNVTGQAPLEATAPIYFKRLLFHDWHFGVNERSKIIYRPERLHDVWTHRAVELSGYSTVVLPSDLGVLMHYRSHMIPQSQQSEAKRVDLKMCFYSNLLSERMNSTLQYATRLKLSSV